jgi:hypothetical protein
VPANLSVRDKKEARQRKAEDENARMYPCKPSKIRALRRRQADRSVPFVELRAECRPTVDKARRDKSGC